MPFSSNENYNHQIHKVMFQVCIHNSFLQKYKQNSNNMFVAEWAIEKELTRQQQDTFIVAWSFVVVKDAKDTFHCNFKEGMQAHFLGYKGVNLGWTTNFHK